MHFLEFMHHKSKVSDVDANEVRSFEVKKGDVLFTRTSEQWMKWASVVPFSEVTDTVLVGLF